MRLSVIIPAYNEEKRIVHTLEDIDKYLSTQDYDYEIIVVNDGSQDRTSDVVRGATERIRNLRLIDNKQNRGKGFVVRQGMLEAKGEFRLFTDADNSTTIDHIEKFWPYFKKGFDIVIGSRVVKGAILDPPQSWFRRQTGRTFRLLTNIFTGLWEIKDTQCGFKCFTKKAVEDIFPCCQIDRFSFDVEMLVIAKLFGYKIKEVPIRWVNDPHSKVKFKNMVKMGLDLLRIRLNLIKGLYAKERQRRAQN
ncbi:glycosyltransferase family 2 protein [bacterium]|nr:glycosyltransferase family 2 protein [bacterium]